MRTHGAGAVAEGPPRFSDRVLKRFFDPTIFALPIVAVAFLVLRAHGLIAEISTLAIVMLLLGAFVLAVLTSAIWPGRIGGWRLYFRVGSELAAITLVIYAVGWGPTLALGLVFGVADCMRTDGSSVAGPAMVLSVVFIGLGQVAIATGLVPTLVRTPLVHALAALAVLGLVFTAKLLGWVFGVKERVESSLSASERRFKALVQQAADLILVVDREDHITYVSPAVEEVLGYDESQAGSLVASDLTHPDDLQRISEAMQNAGATAQQTTRLEARLRTAAGDWLCFDVRLANRLEDPDVAGVVANLHDITDRKASEAALREAEERFRSSFEEAPIGIGLVDPDGRIFRANRAFGDILGRSPDALVGAHVRDLTHPEDREASASELRRLLAGEIDNYQIDKRYVHADGHPVWTSLKASCVRDSDGAPLYAIGQVEDITERRAMNEWMAHAAIHDPLTDLANRALFMDRLQLALSRAERRRGHVAVIFLDLDHFKLINDAMGHDGGDQLLQAVAERIQESVRPEDTVARFGGDEFTILCEELSCDSTATELAERVASALAVPFDLMGAEVFVTASIGIAQSAGGRKSASALLREADAAMYSAKERGRASIEIYDEVDDLRAVSRLRTGNDLHRAIDREELELHYQPLVDLHTSTMVGIEALVRWRHPTRGLLYPGQFIELAEDTGMIVRLGEWTLREACRQVACWRSLRERAGLDPHRLNVSVNVSPRQLAERGFPSQVAEVIHDTGIDPDALWLEITENTLMRDRERALAALGALRHQGIHVAIDDFGTGYSSLSYLKQLPVETLKIDQSFVDGLGQDPEDSAIVRAVIGLAESLGLACIAEGVETTAQVKGLRDLGCQLAQGFLFGRPLSPEQLGTFPADDLSSWNSSSKEEAGLSAS